MTVLNQKRNMPFQSDRYIRDKQISNLLQALFLSDVIESEKAFDGLCFYFNEHDIKVVCSQLAYRHGMEGMYWLIRYLVTIQCPMAFEKLFSLLESDDETIREAVCLGIKKLPVDIQAEFLLKNLSSDKKEAVYFAVSQLGELKIQRAVGPLLSHLAEKNDKQLQLTILNALGKIRAARSFFAVEQLTYSDNKKIRQAAFMAVGAFAATHGTMVIKRCLTSENSDVRKIAYLTILRSGKENAEKYVVSGLAQEQDIKLKLDILITIREIKSYQLFSAVLSMATQDPSLTLRTMAASAIRRVKSVRMRGWILREIHSEKKSPREFLLRLLSEYTEAIAIQAEFEKILTHSQDQVIKLIALDAIGYGLCHTARPLLLEMVKRNDDFSYAAAVSLSRMLTLEDFSIVEQILQLDHKEHSLTIQIFLNFLLCLPKGKVLPDTIAGKVNQLTNSDNISIRYLAVKCYAEVWQERELKKYFGIAALDKHVDIRKVAFRAMADHLSEKPYSLVTILSLGLKNPRFFLLCSRLFKTVYMRNTENFQLILQYLLQRINYFQDHPQEGRLLDDVRLMSLIRNLIVKEKFLFFELWREQSWNKRNLFILIKILNATPLGELNGLDVDFMAQQFKDAALETKCEFLRFFANLSNRGPAVEKIIFEALTAEQDAVLRKEITSVLKTWMTRSLTYS